MKKNKIGLVTTEVWTKYSGSGRPDRFLEEFSSYEEAKKFADEYEEAHPADWVGIGNTYKDSEGFLQWV